MRPLLLVLLYLPLISACREPEADIPQSDKITIERALENFSCAAEDFDPLASLIHKTLLSKHRTLNVNLVRILGQWDGTILRYCDEAILKRCLVGAKAKRAGLPTHIYHLSGFPSTPVAALGIQIGRVRWSRHGIPYRGSTEDLEATLACLKQATSPALKEPESWDSPLAADNVVQEMRSALTRAKFEGTFDELRAIRVSDKLYRIYGLFRAEEAEAGCEVIAEKRGQRWMSPIEDIEIIRGTGATLEYRGSALCFSPEKIWSLKGKDRSLATARRIATQWDLDSAD